jgi:hypothetical protein
VLKSTKGLILAALALGALLGYAAASGKLNPFERANAAPPEPATTVRSADTPDCGGKPALKNELLVLAAHNHGIEAKAQKRCQDRQDPFSA